MFRNHPESLQRIEPWLDRELHVLLGADEDVELVKEFVLSLMRTYAGGQPPGPLRRGADPAQSGPAPRPVPRPATTCSPRRR